MKPVLNPFFEQTSFDSAAPSGTAAVVHKFEQPGEYSLAFLGDDATIARVPLTIATEVPGKGPIPDRVTVDLKKLDYPAKMGGPSAQREPFLVRTGGYVLFTMSGRSKAYAVVAEPAAGQKEGRFDTRRLERGDLFAVTLIRPGEYRLSNTIGGRDGRITVSYPVVGDRPYRPPEPMTVDCNDKGFEPNAIALQPAQGITFRILAPSRITIELVQPDDGPRDRPKRGFSLPGLSSQRIVDRLRQARKEKERS